LAGAIVGCCACNLAWILRRLSSSPPAEDGASPHRRETGDAARYWKYYRTYRYVPPASRRDVVVPLPAKSCGAGPDYAGWFALSGEERSRQHEDRIIYEALFKDHPDVGGTYLELGAFDGKQESNTRFFDECLGWQGLLIEGNPESYQRVLAHRPFAHKMSLAPSCSAADEAANGTIPFYRYPITNVGLVGRARTYAGKPTVDVPCGPLAPVLADVFAADGGPALDFFSLDVEGAEALVLATVDFRAVRINVLMIEIENNHCQSDKCAVRRQVRAKMAAEGYQRYERLVKASDVYVHPDSMFQISEAVAKPSTTIY
jgi:hypothetical protein